ncbi:maintenance of mitochondrial morphology protein 1 domain-containing protein [Sarocladium implicatum]|nr:maintenance of mitochondrial morphology protein 1 domain-containing protein [Sarocladium implicatum]
MGVLSSFLFAYLLGGITFIPLVIISVLAHAYYTFPIRDDTDPSTRLQEKEGEDAIVQPGDDTAALEAVKKDDPKAQRQDPGVAAGYFAVCRDYTPMGMNAKPIERSTPVGSATVAAPSQSVYQTMYRSLFDRKNASGPTDNSGASARPKKAGNVFYIVLRHGHLMLFDDDEQLEVRHVISLAHHDIDIYSGGDVTPEGELFIKRNALRLKRKETGRDIAPDTQISKPFFLFSENCSEKEDFYFALLRNQEQTFGAESDSPKPQLFEVKNIISLVQKLHSSDDQLQTRWFNALLGRVFLGVYQTADIESFIREKITKKISRVNKPSFLSNITMRDMDMGDSAPIFTNFKLKDLTVEGECVVEADVRYTGNFRGEIAATAKLDLGQRFKSHDFNLVLAAVLQRLDGHVLFKIKPPPSNRIWFSFQSMPKMEMALEPIVSSRQITYTVILRQIESRIKEVFAETLVQPFWDDIPFFKTEHKKWRGGIFSGDNAVPTTHNAEKDVARHGDVETVETMEDADQPKAFEKSHTLPVLETQQVSTGIFGRRLSKSTVASATSSATGTDGKGSDEQAPLSAPLSPKIMRSGQEPIVGTIPTHAETFRPSSSPPDHASNFMAALHSRSQEPSPLGSPGKSTSMASKDEGDESENSIPSQAARRNTASSAESGSTLDGSDNHSLSALRDSFKDHTGSLGRSFFNRRENSNTSLTSTAPSQGSDGAHKRNTLLAVTNAAKQAQQWGWNAIQKQREGKKPGETPGPLDLTQPMGGGQPLPPPGTPLPRPSNGATKIGPATTPKRKPVPAQSATEKSEERGEEATGKDNRQTPPPPLPQRRRRGVSHAQDTDDEPNMLVVAMPSDSEPGTPATDNPKTYEGPWNDERDEQSSEQQKFGDQGSEPASTQLSSDAEATETPPSEELLGTPIMAMPAKVTAEDDDDYSGWMDEDPLEEEKARESGVGEDDQPPLPPRAATSAVQG